MMSTPARLGPGAIIFLALKLFVTILAWPSPVLDWGEDPSGIRCPHHLSQTVTPSPSPLPRASIVCVNPLVHIPVPVLLTDPPGSPITLGTKSHLLSPMRGDLERTEQDRPEEIECQVHVRFTVSFWSQLNTQTKTGRETKGVHCHVSLNTSKTPPPQHETEIRKTGGDSVPSCLFARNSPLESGASLHVDGSSQVGLAGGQSGAAMASGHCAAWCGSAHVSRCAPAMETIPRFLELCRAL